MEEFLKSIRRAMGNSPPHILSTALDLSEWRTASNPHVWQPVECSRDGSIQVWLDTAYGYIAVQYECEGVGCFAFGTSTIATPDFLIINRTLFAGVHSYIWRPEQ